MLVRIFFLVCGLCLYQFSDLAFSQSFFGFGSHQPSTNQSPSVVNQPQGTSISSQEIKRRVEAENKAAQDKVRSEYQQAISKAESSLPKQQTLPPAAPAATSNADPLAVPSGTLPATTTMPSPEQAAVTPPTITTSDSPIAVTPSAPSTTTTMPAQPGVMPPLPQQVPASTQVQVTPPPAVNTAPVGTSTAAQPSSTPIYSGFQAPASNQPGQSNQPNQSNTNQGQWQIGY